MNNNTFTLAADNYFSPEAMRRYMSNSQFKSFMKCSAAAMVELNETFEDEKKDCFVEGHMFEALVCGDEELFYMQNPQIISSQGKTKGQPKSNYLKIITAAEAFKRQETMMQIVNRCEKQKIITGEINGVPYKGCIDLYDPLTGDCWDTKCMRDFKSQYSADEGRRLEWWELYGYHYQGAIYRELCRQMQIKTGRFGLMAATKEDVPDVAWLEFDNQLLNNAYDVVYELSPYYNAIKVGLVDPEPCGACNYCKSVKKLTEPALLTEYQSLDDAEDDND